MEHTIEEHHIQQDYCYTRPQYRNGGKPTAVKVYSICEESPYLLVWGVPALKLKAELRATLSRYGKLQALYHSQAHQGERFTETWCAVWGEVRGTGAGGGVVASRRAKRALDARTFYGSPLHLSYAPELEPLETTRRKLHERRSAVRRQLAALARATQLRSADRLDAAVPQVSPSSSPHQPQPQPSHAQVTSAKIHPEPPAESYTSAVSWYVKNHYSYVGATGEQSTTEDPSRGPLDRTPQRDNKSLKRKLSDPPKCEPQVKMQPPIQSTQAHASKDNTIPIVRPYSKPLNKIKFLIQPK